MCLLETKDLAYSVKHVATAGSCWADIEPVVCRCSGMRLGIVGMGRIGTAVAQRARAFGFELSFYDPYLSAGAEKGFGGFVRHTSFEDLVADSDVLTFHCPLTDITRGMLNTDTLPSKDHPGLFVVNCARGGIAEEDAIIEGLADGRLRGVALDSLSTEPNVSPELLRAQGEGAHLMITPHAAFYSDEAFVGASQTLIVIPSTSLLAMHHSN